ncbi:16S rRNA (guanine(527)-N(7))-methyltransferase RsmG [Sphingosinicella ginsenosidimutans]|uniref:Ribosomal RNA small subunit methyltransferase G n=1 Tax=Allosphingosinicella ginsenosidimutans TaxID=1176539 RepID=A0A5C6TSP4_9SPHN|nr:16S rRNA (guanine(527)-N(7))-methyltransferase RsmG [Sphingosinicella ginsenosidimutans]TXC63276.1 16S rRNA (guanine(527)-N(7))-methyltransferase RsmG [Sphingosinicella ginsenosidimutans]
MTEEEARAWVERSFDVPRGTMDRLDAFAALIRAESQRQNLVSKASLDSLWLRHIADSAQLVRLAPSRAGSWVDLGSGAGFPGLIVALLHAGPVTMIEERRLRVDFLHRAAAVLGIEAEILPVKVERAPARRFDVISARAFAPLPRLLDLGTALSTGKSRWVLPKGRNAESELAALDPSWQGRFELHASVTDADARIIVADGVHRAKGRRT